MSQQTAAAEFWRRTERYHELAEHIEKNIVVTEPKYVTSRRMCPCLEYTPRCPFPLNGKVEYYEYRGPKI